MIALKNRGDTIVEVIIALAISSFLIVTAYTSSTRSLTGAQQSQDRGQGLKIAESQAEALRLLTQPVILAPATFCMNMAVSPPAPVPISGIPLDVNSETTATFSSYGATCSSPDGRYHMSIIHPSPPSLNTFDVRVRWERATGGNDEVDIKYTVF